jgi:protein ImuB
MTAASKPSPSRLLAVQLPLLSTDRIRRDRLGRSWRSAGRRDAAEPAAPLVLYERLANADRIAALCEKASALGLSPGLGLADARARFPGLDVVAGDRAADAVLLAALADWCDRYTPLVALDPPHGLILDISGCAHLFGGEKALMDDLLARLFHQGFCARAAIAGHAGTALAVVAASSGKILARGEEHAAVAPLPIGVLRLGAEETAKLERLGLKSVGALAELPRQSLARRFGAALLTRLDESLGLADRPISPRRAIPALMAERRFAAPISQVEDIQRIIGFLAQRLCQALERRGEGARRLELSLFRVDGKVERVRVAASLPLRTPERIAALFRERLKGFGEDIDAGFGFDLVRLAVSESETLAERQQDLSGEQGAEGDLAGLIDRLGARLGEAQVLQIEARASHWPERAMRIRPAVAGLQGGSARRSATARALAPADALPAEVSGPRPVRLLADPEPVEATFAVPDGVPLHFRWRRALHVVRRVEGPERIAPEWWLGKAERARDYFRIEDADGRRFWLFRKEQAAAPGEGGHGDAVARWFMHGIFA